VTACRSGAQQAALGADGCFADFRDWRISRTRFLAAFDTATRRGGSRSDKSTLLSVDAEISSQPELIDTAPMSWLP